MNLVVTSTGTKTFYIRKKIEGESKRYRLGNYPDLSVENARNMALDIKNTIAQGDDPFAERNKKKLELTLDELFEIYLERHAIPHKKPYSVKGDVQCYTNHITKTLGKKRLSAINVSDITQIHTTVGKTKIYMANRILALLKTVFNKAIHWSLLEGINPAVRVKQFKEKSRDRFLLQDEIPRFFKALEEEGNLDVRDYVYLSLYTGARRQNVLSLRWADLDLVRGVWRIEESKNGEVLRIPLIDEALSILYEREKSRQTASPYVFSANSKTGHLHDPKKGWSRILERAGIENLRLHDLRRTLGSYQAINGTSLHIIGQSLGHKSLVATQIYSRLTVEPVRKSMSEAVQSIHNLCGTADKYTS